MKHSFLAILGANLYFFLPLALGQDAGEQEAKELVAKAQELAKAKELVQAIPLMKKAIQLAPKNDQYLAFLSDFEMKADQFADGLEHALAAIKLNDKVGAYYVLAAGNAFWDQDLDQARQYSNVLLKGGVKAFGPVSYRDAQMIDDLLAKKTFTLFWKLDPQKGRMVNGLYTIALPKDGLPYQKVSYEISGVKSHKLVKGEVNDLLQVVTKGKDSFPLTIKVTVGPHSFKKELAKAAPKSLPADARANLGPLETINPKSSALKKIVAGLKEDDSVATVRNIITWMKKNVEYKLEKTSIVELDFKTVDEIVGRGHAECRGYAMLFTALCRSADIPARPIWGILRVPPGADKKYGDIVSHNWAEFYTGGGWIPVDPQRPETLGFLPNYYLRTFMDAKKSKTSTETLPVLNLMFMHGDRLKFEEAR